MASENERIYQVMRSFRRVSRTLSHLLWETADDLHATVVQIMVLRVLDKCPDIGLNELADRLELGNSTMSGVVERLVSADLVERKRSAKDRRSLTMRLTREGKEKKDEAFGEDSVLVKKLSKVLEIPSEDLEHLLRTHERIIEQLENKGDGVEL